MKDTLMKPIGKDFVTIRGIEQGICNRCLSITNPVDRTLANARYCADCRELGLITEWTTMYRSIRPLEIRKHHVELGFSLSPLQVEASDFVEKLCEKRENGFLWAVCGAGKTEILYAGIQSVLNRGGRVCFAIPRKDIVLELAERLAHTFPNTLVKPLCEGYKDDTGAHLVVSTIHQLIGYYHEFDLLIVDEADAFPYAGNAMLERLIGKAVQPDGSVIKMSATLNLALRKDLGEGMKHFVIPSRFHRRPLPVPKIVAMAGFTCPDAELLRILAKETAANRQVLLFVPTLSMGKNLRDGLIRNGYEKTAYVSSQTEGNSAEIADFRQHRMKILVTTAILERGVTFPDIDVLVYHAEHEIYSNTTLVQISGRVGRHPDYPFGQVVFLMIHPTKAAIDAIKSIRKMNKIANQKGLIDS